MIARGEPAIVCLKMRFRSSTRHGHRASMRTGFCVQWRIAPFCSQLPITQSGAGIAHGRCSDRGSGVPTSISSLARGTVGGTMAAAMDVITLSLL